MAWEDEEKAEKMKGYRGRVKVRRGKRERSHRKRKEFIESSGDERTKKGMHGKMHERTDLRLGKMEG